MWLSRGLSLLGLSALLLCIGLTYSHAQTDSTPPPIERVSQGHWLTGLSALWDAKQSENTTSFTGSNVYGDRSEWLLQLTGVNVLYGRTGVGAAVRYGRNTIDENFLNSDGDSVQLDQLKTTLGVYGIFRPYTPLFDTRTIYAFAEMSVGVSVTPTTREEVTKGILTRTYTDQTTFSIGMSPGVAVVLENGLAFEGVITLIGYSASWTEVEKNGVIESSSSAQSFDLQVNVLSLRLGLGFYF